MPTIVNGEQIEDAEVRQEAKLIYERLMEERAPNESPLTINLRASEWALENVIERTLLRQAALKDAEPIAPEVLEVAIDQIRSQSPGRSGCVLPGSEQAYRRQVEVNLCIERLIGKLTERIARPKHKEVIEYYQKNRGAFYVPELVHAAHIVKNVGPEVDEEAGRAAIANAHAELQNGRSFEEVADEFSDCPGRGGDLGFFPRGQMVEEFENVVFALQPGQNSQYFRQYCGGGRAFGTCGGLRLRPRRSLLPIEPRLSAAGDRELGLRDPAVHRPARRGLRVEADQRRRRRGPAGAPVRADR